jgi:hypothetical protein
MSFFFLLSLVLTKTLCIISGINASGGTEKGD